MRALRLLKRSTRRRRRPSRRGGPAQTAAIDRGLLADVEHLAAVVADTIGRLHAARRGDIARPLEEALDRLGRR